MEADGIEIKRNNPFTSINIWHKLQKEFWAMLKQDPDIIIIDSFSLIGELAEALILSDKKITSWHWGHIKQRVKDDIFTPLFKSRAHIIITAREKNSLETKNDISYGLDVDYYTSYVFRTEKQKKANQLQFLVDVIKDRKNIINGRTYDNTTSDITTEQTDFNNDFGKLLNNLEGLKIKIKQKELYGLLKSKISSARKADELQKVLEEIKGYDPNEIGFIYR